MPTYVYSCQNPDCGFYFEAVTLIADRHNATKKKCTECGKKKIELVPAAPVIGDATRLGVKKLPNWWTDKLSNMKSKHAGSTIKVSRTMEK